MTAGSGMARERTALSWRRTAIGAMATAALFVSHAIVGGRHHSAAAPLAAALMLIVLAATSFRRGRTLRHGKRLRSHREITLTTTVITLVCIVALAISLADPLF